MNYDLANNMTGVASLPPAAQKASTNGATVDTQNAHKIMAVFTAGAWTDGSHTPVLQESPDGQTWNNVAAVDMAGPGFSAISSAAGQNTVQRVSYIGNLRYIRVGLTVTGSPATGMMCSATVLLGQPTFAPQP